MADNAQLPATGVGTADIVVATDKIAGVDYQRIKAGWGPDGTYNDPDTASGKAFPVQLYSATGLIPGGEPTDAAVTETDTTSVSWTSLLKQISKSIQLMVFGAGTAAAAQRTTLASDDPLVAKTPNLTPTSGPTLSSLASAATSAQALASNASRKGVIAVNTDANAVYLKFGTTASLTDFSVVIPSGAMWEMPLPIYTGRIDAIWAADGAGGLYMTEA